MRVVSIRRYPVKAMGGEALNEAELDHRGLTGDRWYAVVDTDGRLAAGKDTRRFRRRDAVFGFTARSTDSGVRVSGRGLDLAAEDPTLAAELSSAMGAAVRVLPERPDGTNPHHDAAPVSIVGTASLAWCRERLDADAQQSRLRANLLVETDQPFAEESWLGSELDVGGLRLRVSRQITRCRVVDLAQDGITTTTGLLKALGRHRDLRLGVYADVLAPGTIRVGDPVAVRDR